MSMQTFMALVLANTQEEKELAHKEHAASEATKPSDAENIALFLSKCEIGAPIIH